MSYELAPEMIDTILETCEYWDVKCEAFPDYSGRGMYGKNCVGFTTDNPFGLGAVICWVAKEQMWEDLGELVDDTAMDSMGRDTIVYFPRFTTTWVDPEDAEDDE